MTSGTLVRRVAATPDRVVVGMGMRFALWSNAFPFQPSEVAHEVAGV